MRRPKQPATPRRGPPPRAPESAGGHPPRPGRTRRLRAAALSCLAALVSGCGRPRAPRDPGPFRAVRLTRAVPAHARLTPGDLAAVEVPADALPDHGSYPRDPAEVAGAAARLPLPAGLVLRDAHLDRHPILPPAGAAAVRPGEWGLVAPVEGLAREASAGGCYRVAGVAVPLRLAAVSEPAPGTRSAILAAPRAAMLQAIRAGLRFPLAVAGAGLSGCPTPPGVPAPASQAPVKVLVSRRALDRGARPSRQDLEERQLPARLLPLRPLDRESFGAGGPLLHPVPADQPLWRDLIGPPGATGPATKLFVPGLHPDWVHPGAVVYYLRANSPDAPQPLLVTDIERAVRGTPTPLKVRPLPGHDWPVRRTRAGHEGGDRRWVLLLSR